jgi:hypothetical protein
MRLKNFKAVTENGFYNDIRKINHKLVINIIITFHRAYVIIIYDVFILYIITSILSEMINRDILQI